MHSGYVIVTYTTEPLESQADSDGDSDLSTASIDDSSTDNKEMIDWNSDVCGSFCGYQNLVPRHSGPAPLLFGP
jgi:hypothetical protein